MEIHQALSKIDTISFLVISPFHKLEKKNTQYYSVPYLIITQTTGSCRTLALLCFYVTHKHVYIRLAYVYELHLVRSVQSIMDAPCVTEHAALSAIFVTALLTVRLRRLYRH
jgi:hypothetical protein